MHLKSRHMIGLMLIVTLALSGGVNADGRSTLTLDNKSGEDALVRLVGPASGLVEVPAGAARTIRVRGGQYRMYVRYGEPGQYHYARGDAFSVTESEREYEEVTITLHKVRNGNYGTSPSNEAEFNGGRE